MRSRSRDVGARIRLGSTRTPSGRRMVRLRCVNREHRLSVHSKTRKLLDNFDAARDNEVLRGLPRGRRSDPAIRLDASELLLEGSHHLCKKSKRHRTATMMIGTLCANL